MSTGTPQADVVQLNITLDAYSPLIVYSPPVDNTTWFVGGSDGDPQTFDYNNGTFMFSDQTNASATLNFTGTGVQIVGAYRPNDGPYMIMIDGQEPSLYRTGPPPEQSIFDYVMFDNRNSLEHRAHTVTIVNAASVDEEGLDGKGYMDIDYISFSTNVSSAIADRIQDTDPEFVYTPASDWDIDNGNFPGFDQGTVHYTTSPNANATLNFQGTRIIVYGAVGDLGAPYSVQIDEEPVQQYNGSRPGFGYRPQEILFYMDNLLNTSHSITLMALPNLPPPSDDPSLPMPLTQYFSIDYAIVDGYALDATVSPGAPGTPESAAVSDDSRVLSKGDIAGIVVGSIGALAVLSLTIWIFTRLRHRRRHNHRSYKVPVQGDKASENLSNTMLIIEPWIPEESRARLSVIGPLSVESHPTDEKAPIYGNESSEAEDGYPVERERLKQVAAARDAQAAEASAIDPLPIYEV